MLVKEALAVLYRLQAVPTKYQRFYSAFSLLNAENIDNAIYLAILTGNQGLFLLFARFELTASL